MEDLPGLPSSRTLEDIDLVHDAKLGLEGKDLIFQVEKHSNLSLVNVKCTRTLVRPRSCNGEDQGILCGLKQEFYVV